MQFSNLPNELLVHVFQSCSSVPDVLNLAATCHQLRSILSASQRLPILFQVAEAQFGPLADAISLVTHNASQPAHIRRASPPLSLALLTSLLEVGQVANEWANIYPYKKWRGEDSASRRLLSSLERYRVRRAIYRLWLYTTAFHSPFYLGHSRNSSTIIRLRAALLRPWSTPQLAELLDVQSIFRVVIERQICPSNSLLRSRHRARYPDDTPVVPLLGYASNVLAHTVQVARSKVLGAQEETFCSLPITAIRKALVWGWGDEIPNYYIVQDMLKLDPGRLLHLYQSVTQASSSSSPDASSSSGFLEFDPNGSGFVVEKFVSELGEWFENNGQTLTETIKWVINERDGDGDDWEYFKSEALHGGGITREEEIE